MIINLRSQTALSGFYIVFEGSTNLETPGIYGMSHLLEHLIFKSVDHLQEDYDRSGLEYNAYTSGNSIVFYLQGLDNQVLKYKDQFLDLLLQFQITEEQLEMERQIVLSEYEDCFNEQSQNHQLNWSRKYLQDFDAIGLREDLEKISIKDVKDFFDLQFSKPTRIINVSNSKPFVRPDIQFKTHELSKIYKFGNYNSILESGNSFKDKTSIIVSGPLVDEYSAYISYINSMLGHGLRSPLYDEIREKKGLVYFIHCYQNRLNKQGISLISTQTSNKKVPLVLDGIEKIIRNPDTYLTQDRFDLVKDYYSIKQEKNEILRYKNIDKWIEPNGSLISDILPTVSLNKIREIYDEFYNWDKFYVSIDKNDFK